MHESKMQAIMMDWCMERKKHQLVMPNLRSIYRWEADLISLTKAWFVHEFEIKLTVSDFRADYNKKFKHHSLKFTLENNSVAYYCPNYFWYVTYDVDISEEDIPRYAGWIEIEHNLEASRLRRRYAVRVRRDARRLHTDKLPEKTRLKIGRWLSYKLKNEYYAKYLVNSS